MPRNPKIKKWDIPYINRELSWLSFNARVLQEAADLGNPLGERIKFLGIYSSNLDEFFRVRVAMARRNCQRGQKGSGILREDPREALGTIQKEVMQQRRHFNVLLQKLFRDLQQTGLELLKAENLNEEQNRFAKDHFEKDIRHKIFPILVNIRYKLPELKDKTLYLAVELGSSRGERHKFHYSIIEIPTNILPRFIILPSEGKKTSIMLIDEMVRIGLPLLFKNSGFDYFKAWSFKVIRDSELDIDEDDITLSYLNKINRGVEKRRLGDPVWFLYDSEMDKNLLEILLKKMKFKHYDTVTPGGRYHNFSDFMDFPKLLELPCCQSPQSMKHKDFSGSPDLFKTIKAKDFLLYFPYHSFDTVIDLLREASLDSRVESIKVTLYRVANYSSVVNALITARKNRKEVLVILELQARFDEKNNIYWANILKENDVKVIFGVEGLKVHSKLLLINRKEGGKRVRYGGIGTGNLNEDTARLYTDCFLITAHRGILEEVEALFNFFENNYRHPETRHLMISPYGMRSGLTRLIEQEMTWAQKGKKASIRIKLNNLCDEGIIRKLYEASRAGVKIKLIIRGRFSLVPGMPGFSENIEAISILDHYLEHARFFIFDNGGDPLCFISSADWLTRNLDRRVEVTCPIYKNNLKQQLQHIFDIQWQDNQKARILDKGLNNDYVPPKKGVPSVRSQKEVRNYFAQLQGDLKPPAK